MSTQPDPITTWKPLLGLIVGVAVLLGVVLTAFAWPTTQLAPRSLPVAVVAPPPLAAQIGSQLAANLGEDAFALTVAADREAAVTLIEDRRVYGALLLDPQGGEVLIASAASPAVAQLLAQLGAGIPPQAGGPLRVTDLKPLPAGDPRGSGLPSAVLPLVIGGMMAGVLMSLRVRGAGLQLSGVLGIAVAAGLVLTAILQGWLGALEGSYWTNSAVLALGIAAIGIPLLGLHRRFGFAGLGLGAATMVLLGNPLSGVMAAPEMLPAGWGAFGQWLPPGATGTALRSVAWFDGAGAGGAWLVLASWLFAGLILTWAGGRSGRAS